MLHLLVVGGSDAGGQRQFPGSLGTEVVQVFDLAIARTGLRDNEAGQAGYQARSVDVTVDDHKRYYSGATVAKRIDIYAAAIHSGLTVDAISDLDLSYTPPHSSPWDPVQTAAQTWLAALRCRG